MEPSDFNFQPQAFAKEGAQVTATDINGEKLKELDGVPGTAPFCWSAAAICWTSRVMQPGRVTDLVRLLYNDCF